MGLDARLVSFVFVLSVCYYFSAAGKSGDANFFCELKKAWEEKRGQMDTRTKSMKNMTGGQASFCPSTP